MKNLVNKTETGLVNNIGEYRERYADCTSIIDDLDWFEENLADVKTLENIFRIISIEALHLFDVGEGAEIYERVEKYLEWNKNHVIEKESEVLKSIELQNEVEAKRSALPEIETGTAIQAYEKLASDPEFQDELGGAFQALDLDIDANNRHSHFAEYIERVLIKAVLWESK